MGFKYYVRLLAVCKYIMFGHVPTDSDIYYQSTAHYIRSHFDTCSGWAPARATQQEEGRHTGVI